MSLSLLSSFRFRWLFFIGWLLWALVHAGVIYSFGLPVTTAVADSLASNGLLLLTCLLLMNTLRYYVPKSNRYYVLLGWIVVLCFCWMLLLRFSLSFIYVSSAAHSFLTLSLIIRFCIGFLILTSTVLLSVAWYNWQDQQSLQARETEMASMAKEAELYKLRQQLQPHFLFNSLNSINALIMAQPAAARTMVLQLSEFLRGTLKKEEHQWVPLHEEVEHLQLYLEIEKVRFGHRLATVFEMQDVALPLQLPALLLQPVVENAIKFGLYDTTDAITIVMKGTKEDGTLLIKVQNPFDGSNSRKGTGFGLSSIQRRLYLLFGRNDLLSTYAEGNLFTTTLKIPQPQKEPT